MLPLTDRAKKHLDMALPNMLELFINISYKNGGTWYLIKVLVTFKYNDALGILLLYDLYIYEQLK